jgi:hypothetical protein
MKVGELKKGTEEYNQWRMGMHAKLIGKLKRMHDNERLAKLNKRDTGLESELTQIKQHLDSTDSIREQNKVHVEQIYKAWVVVTGYRDDRPFKRRLHEYIDAGYIIPLDSKYKLFRAEKKLLVL